MITPTAADKERARAITRCSEECDPELCWLHETTTKIAQALADERERAAVVADAVFNEPRNLGEDARSGWDAFKIGAATVARRLRSQA